MRHRPSSRLHQGRCNTRAQTHMLHRRTLRSPCTTLLECRWNIPCATSRSCDTGKQQVAPQLVYALSFEGMCHTASAGGGAEARGGW